MTLTRAGLGLVAALLAAGAGLWWYGLRAGGGAEHDAEDQPIVVPERVSVIDGRRIITLDLPMQAQNGIVTAHPQPAGDARRTVITGHVRDTSDLADLYRRDRLARQGAPELADAIRRTVAQRYGAALAEAFASPGPALEDIRSGAAALIEIEVGSGGAAPDVVTARDGQGHLLSLHRLAAAGQSGHWFYRARGRTFAAGETLTLIVTAAPARPGVAVPPSAVVWHDGVPWAYTRREGRLFARVSLDRATPRPDGGYRTDALAPADEIVVQGAELLLSEEFRARIQTEG